MRGHDLGREAESEVSVSPPSLSSLIRQNQDKILQRWEEAIRKIPAAGSLPPPALRHHIPELLTFFSDSLEHPTEGELPRGLETLPDEHAMNRLNEGFDLKE